MSEVRSATHVKCRWTWQSWRFPEKDHGHVRACDGSRIEHTMVPSDVQCSRCGREVEVKP